LLIYRKNKFDANLNFKDQSIAILYFDKTMNSRKIFCIFLILLLCSCDNTKTEIIHPISKKDQQLITVNIVGEDSPIRGSGVLISSSYDQGLYIYHAITASHLINGIKGGDRFQLIVNDGNTYSIELVSMYLDIDLAIVKFRSKSKYFIPPLVKQKAPKNHHTVVSGFLYCEGKSDGIHYKHYSIPGKIGDYDTIFKELSKNSRKDILKKSDLYYSNPTAIGMSGGAIINDFGQIIGIQLATTSDKFNIRNCNVTPQEEGSLGISTNKFLTKKIPQEVKNNLILEDLKIINKNKSPETIPAGKLPRNRSPFVVDGDR
jgi:Trypsin-like peptidase domain